MFDANVTQMNLVTSMALRIIFLIILVFLILYQKASVSVLHIAVTTTKLTICFPKIVAEIYHRNAYQFWQHGIGPDSQYSQGNLEFGKS